MKKIILSLTVLVALASCQEQQKIAFVDNGKVINDYQMKIDIEDKFKQKDEVFKLRMDSIGKAFQAEAQAFQAKEQSLSAKARQEMYQSLTQKHTMKADEIESVLFENAENNVFGMFYAVGGNAASQSQFYVTDSINHFLTGSLYFYAKPNYDSILPAAAYLKNDIKHLMESVEWKE